MRTRQISLLATSAVILTFASHSSAQPAFFSFGAGIVEGRVTYETTGGTVLMTANDLGTTTEFPSDLANDAINGELLTKAFLDALGASDDNPILLPAVTLSTFAQTQLPALAGGVDDAAFIMTPPPNIFLNHSGNSAMTPQSIFSLIPSDLEGLFSGASVTSISTNQVDDAAYYLTVPNPSGGFADLAIVNVAYQVVNIVETVPGSSPNGVPDNGSTLLLMGLGIGGLIFAARARGSRD